MCDVAGDGILAGDGRQPPEPAKRIKTLRGNGQTRSRWALKQGFSTPRDAGFVQDWAVNH